ncbi:M48 family metalloprotease [Methylicorpusculum sp.]|uniref:M48 family metalloprotease n=1 Tax=Methylicorpusculum sp. TaxID=2713644 RepID=UPI002ABCB8F0|nr:M48 family metalloprotease [Methylicorpusculum sp.]MDZ4153960.1 M48 family metalloprotease [Methylicorpusculum sp.]
MHFKTIPLHKFSWIYITYCCIANFTLPAENTLPSYIHNITHSANASVSALLEKHNAPQNPTPQGTHTVTSNGAQKITLGKLNAFTRHATPLAQEFITIAALTLLIEAPHIIKMLFPNPTKMNVGTVENISPEHQKLFEQVCAKLKIDPRTITIKQCTGLKENYHTAALGAGFSLLLFDKQDIDLPTQKLSFVMAHEIAHIKNNDAPKKLAVSFISCTAGAFLAYKPLQKFIQGPRTILTKACALTGFYLLSHWITNTSRDRYSRYQEKRADLTAITALADKQGAIDLFTLYRQENLAERQNLLWQGLTPKETDVDDAGNKLSDRQHPSLSERIAYINAAIL